MDSGQLLHILKYMKYWFFNPSRFEGFAVINSLNALEVNVLKKLITTTTNPFWSKVSPFYLVQPERGGNGKRSLVVFSLFFFRFLTISRICLPRHCGDDGNGHCGRGGSSLASLPALPASASASVSAAVLAPAPASVGVSAWVADSVGLCAAAGWGDQGGTGWDTG